MKKTVLISVVAVLLLMPLMTACGMSVDQAKAQFCKDLGAYGTAVANLRALDANATVGQLKEAQREVDNAWAALDRSAQALGRTQMEETRKAFSELQKAVNDIPDDATLESAVSTVDAARMNAMAAAWDTLVTACSYPQQ